jgi:hypothetical protein
MEGNRGRAEGVKVLRVMGRWGGGEGTGAEEIGGWQWVEAPWGGERRAAGWGLGAV